MHPLFSGTGANVVLSVEPVEHVGEEYRITVSGDYVKVGDRLVPTFLVFEVDGDASTPAVSARVEVRAGAPRVVDLHFVASDSGDIRQSKVREVEVDAVLQLFAAFAIQYTEHEVQRTKDGFEGGFEVRGAIVGTEFDEAFWRQSIGAMRGARGNRKITPEFLQEVADVYRKNLRAGPLQEVARRFLVSKSQAGNYIYQARRAGYLRPTSRGKKRA